ncbi:MAG: OmpA family protein [Mucilaginibacter sp.]|nr:OmpA family protein [Mucilaginibacter sp.]
MKFIKSNFALIISLSALVSLQACKAKKIVQKPAPDTEAVKPAAAPAAASPQPVEKQKQEESPAPVEKPDYNFSNIQFEFNSGILKTNSYPILDKAASEIKKDPSAKFILKGYASAEGTAEHNMTLSADRANSVKAYLINSGVNDSNLTAKGYGESNPVADNSTEAGKALNRRVEIRKQ